MSSKLSKWSVVLLCAMGLISCSSNKESDIIDVTSKTYKLASVQWKIGEGDGVEVIEKEYPVEVFTNTEDVEILLEIDVLKDVEETSLFVCKEVPSELQNGINPEALVSVPSEFSLLSDRYSYLMGGSQAPVVLNTKSILESSRSMISTTQLPKNTKMTINKTVFFNKIQATYLLRFVEEGEGFDSFEVEGKWTGMLFANIERNVVFEEVK